MKICNVVTDAGDEYLKKSKEQFMLYCRRFLWPICSIFNSNQRARTCSTFAKFEANVSIFAGWDTLTTGRCTGRKENRKTCQDRFRSGLYICFIESLRPASEYYKRSECIPFLQWWLRKGGNYFWFETNLATHTANTEVFKCPTLR